MTSTSFAILNVIIPMSISPVLSESGPYMKYILRKYANHLFTTPLANVIFDNMMSRLISTLTKQFFDNQFTHFKIKT